MATKKSKKTKKQNVTVLESKPKDEEVIQQRNEIENPASRKQEIINTTVKIISSFSDMLTTWKDKKVKRYKRRIIIWVCVIGLLILLGLTALVILLILKVI